MKIDRASSNDLVMLAIESGGQVANCVGAVLLLTGGPDFDIVGTQRVVGDRISRIPRLRQRLVRVPLGCGRPVWVDDPLFDAGQHIRHTTCAAPGDEDALLRLAAEVCAAPLPPSRPRWSAVLVSGLDNDKAALILVLHHVLADGVGGLAVLAGLVDQAVRQTGAVATSPRLLPPVRELMVDAFHCRWQELRALPAVLRSLPGVVRSTGGLHPPVAGDCSLLDPTGPRRQIAVSRIDLAALHATAKANGATVNDALLTAVTGALHELLVQRGETLDTLRVTVPIAGDHPRSSTELGNDVSLVVVGLPVDGRPGKRIRQVSMAVRAARARSGGPSPAALFGPLFRALAARGAYHGYLRRQRRFHTIVSNLRGPDRAFSLAGSTIESVTPLSFDDLGNVTVAFVALSYAGTLTVTAIVDPDRVPDLPVLMHALQTELAALAGSRGVR